MLWDDHRRALLVGNKNDERAQAFAGRMRELVPGLEVEVAQRGRLRGSNRMQDCTLCVLSLCSLFTSVHDAALHSVLAGERSRPIDAFFTGGPADRARQGGLRTAGTPAMSHGQFRDPAANQYIALRSVDELYQTVFRTAVRRGQPVEAIVVLPDLSWLKLLWRSVLPGFHVGSSWKFSRGGFVQDGLMGGFCGLLHEPAGRVLEKSEIAGRLGYAGAHGLDEPLGPDYRLALALLPGGRPSPPGQNRRAAVARPPPAIAGNLPRVTSSGVSVAGPGDAAHPSGFPRSS